MAKKPDPLPFPTDEEWKRRVKDALDKMPRGSHTRLAKFLGVSTGNLSGDILGVGRGSPHVPKIHQFLGWSPPLSPLDSLQAAAILDVYRQMTDEQRQFLIDAARVERGDSGAEARTALEATLRLVRAQNENQE